MADNGRITSYINPQPSQQFKNTAAYLLADGSLAINVVCTFAGSYAAAKKTYLRASNNKPPTTQPFNDNIQQILDEGSVQYLQKKELTVLLSTFQTENNNESLNFQEV